MTTQYIQNRSFRTKELSSASQLNKGIAKSEATNVPGRKATVTAAKVFIEDESRLLADASVLESLARAMLRLASLRAIKLKSYDLIELIRKE